MGLFWRNPEPLASDSKLGQLYRKHRRAMYQIAFDILQHEQDAEDAVHSAFEVVAKNLHRIGDVDSSKTRGFLASIAINKAIDLYRLNKRRSEVPYDDRTVGIYVVLPETSDLKRLINKLPENQRKVLLMRRVYQLTVHEAAKALGLSVPNTYKLEKRAEKNLREMYKAEDLL